MEEKGKNEVHFNDLGYQMEQNFNKGYRFNNSKEIFPRINKLCMWGIKLI